MRVLKNNPRCYINRLRKLADFLEDLPPKAFDYSDFAYEAECGLDVKGCKTVACAIGWAPSVPGFKRLGVALDVIKNEYILERENGFEKEVDYYIEPTINGEHVGWADLADHLFGLDYDEYSSLFFPGSRAVGYSGLSEKAKVGTVVKHIRKFCDEKEASL